MESGSGSIIVISGPSGVGKTTLYKRLLSELSDRLSFSVSAATRPPRENEVNGIDYYFLSKEEFERKINSGEFIEWEKVYQNYYGTLKSEITRITEEQKKNCLLDVDVKGGMNIKKAFPHSHLIFIAPPSLDALKARIMSRKTDSAEAIQIRLKTALDELNYAGKYDYTIINENLDKAYLELKRLVESIIH